MKAAPSHVYPITTNHLTWAPKQACGHINNGIAASFCCYDLLLLWNHQPCFDILWLDKCSVFIPRIAVGPGKPAGWKRNLTVTHGDDSSTGNQRASPIPTSSFTPMKNHQYHTGWKRPKRPFCKATWKYYDCVHKAFTRFDKHSRLNKEALSALHKEVVNPVEKHAPTNELISDMNCGVYVGVSLRWSGQTLRGKQSTVVQQTIERVLTETALWDYT